MPEAPNQILAKRWHTVIWWGEDPARAPWGHIPSTINHWRRSPGIAVVSSSIQRRWFSRRLAFMGLACCDDSATCWSGNNPSDEKVCLTAGALSEPQGLPNGAGWGVRCPTLPFGAAREQPIGLQQSPARFIATLSAQEYAEALSGDTSEWSTFNEDRRCMSLRPDHHRGRDRP